MSDLTNIIGTIRSVAENEKWNNSDLTLRLCNLSEAAEAQSRRTGRATCDGTGAIRDTAGDVPIRSRSTHPARRNDQAA
jgi:hypothetical protein